jgi:hypothetical protein
MNVDLPKLLRKVEEQEANLTEPVDQLHKRAESVWKAGITVGESWSGSCFGYHSDLHYGQFEKPPFQNRFNVEWGCLHGIPAGWAQRTPDEVKAEIERRSGDTFEALEKIDAGLVQQVKTLHDEITMESSPLYSLSSAEREKAMLTELEDMKWDDQVQKEHVVNGINGSPRMTRDFNAINEGRRVPSHTYYEGVALGVEAHCDLTRKFWHDAKRLLKQLQARGDNAKPQYDPTQYEVLKEKSAAGRGAASYIFSGDNARVNINSTDRSVNVVVNADNVFAGLQHQIENHVTDQTERTILLEKLGALEEAKGTKSFSERYQEFIATAANHITLVAPFIPVLTQLLGK